LRMREPGVASLVPQGRLKVVQDSLAAYFQPSLRDFSFSNIYPGLRPGLSSAVPAGLILPSILTHTLGFFRPSVKTYSLSRELLRFVL
jgi:hypothetical protein